MFIFYIRFILFFFFCVCFPFCIEINFIAQENIISQEKNYENFVFALTPKDFNRTTLINFVNNMKSLFSKASLVQKYTLMRYLMEAYERVLKQTQLKTESNKKTLLTKNKPTEQLQIELEEDGISAVRATEAEMMPPADYGTRQEMFPTMVVTFGANLTSPSSNSEVMDALNVYQAEAELNKPADTLDSLLTDNNILQLGTQEDLEEPLLPHYQAPLMNISNLFESMETDPDLHVPPLLRQNQTSQPLQETLDLTRRQSERLKAKQLQKSACVAQSGRDTTLRRLRYSLKSPQPSVSLSYLSDTPPLTPQRPKPRTYMSEEEYSLRFRLPRIKFLKITELPRVKFSHKTLELSYFSMDTLLIDEEYLCENPCVPIAINNFLTQPGSVTVMTTAEDYSSLNVVRQAASSMKEMPSFGRPLQPSQIQELSRLENERHLNQNMSPLNDNIANISTDSMPAMGMGYYFSRICFSCHVLLDKNK